MPYQAAVATSHMMIFHIKKEGSSQGLSFLAQKKQTIILTVCHKHILLRLSSSLCLCLLFAEKLCENALKKIEETLKECDESIKIEIHELHLTFIIE